MAERRKPRKRSGKTPPPKPQRDSKRLTLLDLPPAAVPPALETLSSAEAQLPVAEPIPDPPTRPVAVARPEPKRTLLPAPAEPFGDASLESLAQLAHRATGVPLERATTSRMPVAHVPEVLRASAPPPPDPAEYTARTLPDLVAPVAPAPHAPAPLATLPSPPPDFARPSSYPPPPAQLPPSDFARPSSYPPPPVQMPSQPPFARVPRGENTWLRTLGVIVLSATVGAAVSSAIWGVKSELSEAAANRAADADLTRASGAVLAENCATSSPPADTKPAIPTAIAAGTPTYEASALSTEAPRISIEALPVQQSRRREVTAELVSLDTPASTHGSSHESEVRPATHRASRQSEAPRRARNKSKRAPSPPPERTLPAQPSRAAVSQAVARAAANAASCDGGPHDGKVTVTFAPSGAVQSVSMVKGFGDAAVNGCVLRAFGRARVPAFSGDPVQVKKSVAW